LNRIQYKQLLLNSGNDGHHGKSTALHEACKWGHIGCLKTLISSQLYDIDSTLHQDLATPLVLASLSGEHQMVATLLTAGANPLIECNLGYNALVSALISKNADCVRLIIKHHPSILNTLNEYKENCLDILIKFASNSMNTIGTTINDIYMSYIDVITVIILEGITLTKQFILKICHSDNIKIHENFFNHNHYDINTNTNSNKMPVYFNTDIRQLIGHEDVVIIASSNSSSSSSISSSSNSRSSRSSSSKLLAHKFVLQRVSSVLGTMISANSHNRDTENRIIIAFPNNDAQEVELLLDWVYTRKDVTISVNSDVVLSLLLLSSSLQIKQLQYLCESRIALNFKVSSSSLSSSSSLPSFPSLPSSL
jgi:hypothetical protein